MIFQLVKDKNAVTTKNSLQYLSPTSLPKKI